jgi:lipopolysaccharide export system ATP-binding protein
VATKINTAENGNRRRILSVEDLHAGYRGKMVVSDVSVRVAPSEFIGLVGHNGSGKSTVLLGIAGLIQHKCAKLNIDGYNYADKSVYKRKRAGIGILLQRDAVFPNLSIGVNLQLSGGNNLNRFVLYSELYRVLNEIVSRKSVPAGSLSGGERRLLGLVMSIASCPGYFLVDEPTLGLDVALELDIFEMLRNYARTHQAGVLLVSHNLKLVEQKCDRVYVIHEGSINKEFMCGTTGNNLDLELKI